MDPAATNSSTSFRIKVDITELDATRSALAWYFVNATQCESIEQLKEAVFKWFKLDSPPENVELWLDECVVPNDAPVLLLSANDLIVLRNKKSEEAVLEVEGDVAEDGNVDKEVKTVLLAAVASTEAEIKKEAELAKQLCDTNEGTALNDIDEPKEVDLEEKQGVIFISSMKSEYELQMSSINDETQNEAFANEVLAEEGQKPIESDKVVEENVVTNDIEILEEIPKSGEAKTDIEANPIKVGQSTMVKNMDKPKPPSNQAQNRTGPAKKKKKKKTNRTSGSAFRRDQRRLQAHLKKLNIPYEIRPDPKSLNPPATTSAGGNQGRNQNQATSKKQQNQNNSGNKRKLNNNSGRGGSSGVGRGKGSKNQKNRNNSAKRRRQDGNSDRNRLSYEDDYYHDDNYYDYNNRDDNYGYDNYSFDRGEMSYERDAGYDSQYQLDSMSYGHSSTFDPLGGSQSQYSNTGINVNLLDPSIRSPGSFSSFGGGGGNYQNQSGGIGGGYSLMNRPPSLMSLPLVNSNIHQRGVGKNNRNNNNKKQPQQNNRKKTQKNKKRNQRREQMRNKKLSVPKPLPKPLKGILKKTNSSMNETSHPSSSSSFDNDPYLASVDYSQYPTLRRFPKVNDIIAYKMLESSGGPFADISDYKVGKVVQYDDATKEMLLEFPEPVVLCENSEKGGAEDEFIEEVAVDFGSIVEVRLITDDKWR